MMTNYARKGFKIGIFAVLLGIGTLGLAWLANNVLTSKKIRAAVTKAYVDIDDTIKADHVAAQEAPPHLGELVYPSIAKVARKLRIGFGDVVYELKCGAGKLSISLYLMVYAKRMVGVEPCEAYFQEAKKARKALQANHMINGYRPLVFRNEALTQTDLQDATVIFMCAPYFLEASTQALAEQFLTLKPGLRILSIKELPEHPRLKLVDTLTLATSWADSMPFYFYKLLP